jgi:hypothetical protein
MRSRIVISLALFAVVALALPSIINRHGAKTNSPETKVSEWPRRVASNNSVRDSQAQSTQPLPSRHGNQSYDIAAEDVRPVPNSPFTQIVFRLPDNISVGACIITLKVHGETSNSGSIRIRT